MIRKTITAICLLGILNAQAQVSSNSIKLHGGAELTTGLFSKGYNTGWGVYATGYRTIADGTSLSFSSGVAYWKAKDDAFKVGMSLNRLGLRQFLSGGLYLQGDAGVAVGLQMWSGTTRFVYGGALGHLFRTAKGGGFDISARANRSFNRTWIGLAAGYEFKL